MNSCSTKCVFSCEQSICEKIKTSHPLIVNALYPFTRAHDLDVNSPHCHTFLYKVSEQNWVLKQYHLVDDFLHILITGLVDNALIM